MTPPTDLQGVINFRDVGSTVNQFLGQRRIREGVFYRSARLDEATAADRKLLTEDLRIQTVIDLRSKTELVKQAQKHHAQIAAAAAAHVQSNAVVAKPLHIEGLTYHEIKITGRPFEKHLLSQLSWWAFIRFLVLFVLGYRMQAVSIIGREVMLPRGLVGLGLDTLDQSGPDIRQTLSIYANPATLPVVIHCTQGKDRTGLICALLLMILGVPVTAIEHDYFLTDAALAPERADRVAELREIGVTDDWVDTAPGMITGIQKHLDDKYGGLEDYLDGIDFGEEERAKVREALLY